MMDSLFLAQQSGSSLTGFLPILLLVAIFYFMLSRPMRKRQKNHDEMISSLKSGDRVITSGGVHGTVVAVKESTAMLKVADQVKIEVTKSAISSRQLSD
jgi:preprotein translocase subunit YajC